jgi:hypothetical protein
MATERNAEILDPTIKASADLYATRRQPIHGSHYLHALHIYTQSPSFFNSSSIIQRMGGMVHQMMMQELLP